VERVVNMEQMRNAYISVGKPVGTRKLGTARRRRKNRGSYLSCEGVYWFQVPPDEILRRASHL
jgi:hypothetical protein